MRRLVHLSDLHFGRDRPDLMRPLIETVNAMKPDLVVISGDLTQRATEAQFRAAATFIAALEAQVLAVPGNHDVPLHNMALRLFRPWMRYRNGLGPELAPAYRDGVMDVVGVNTTDPYAWQRGRFRRRDMRRVARRLAEADGRVRVVVAHHPLRQALRHDKTPMLRAEAAVRCLSAAGVDLYLTGHLHAWDAEILPMAAGGRMFLQVTAGTGLSTRVREDPNDFNLITLAPAHIRIARHVAHGAPPEFGPAEVRDFRMAGEGGWVEA